MDSCTWECILLGLTGDILHRIMPHLARKLFFLSDKFAFYLKVCLLALYLLEAVTLCFLSLH